MPVYANALRSLSECVLWSVEPVACLYQQNFIIKVTVVKRILLVLEQLLQFIPLPDLVLRRHLRCLI
jgi:hypothetical protein